MSVSFTLDSKRYEVTPGGTFTMALTVTNTGTQVDQFKVTIRGIPGVIVSLEPHVLNLEGGRHQDVRARVTLPLDATMRAGRHVVAAQVWAKNDRSAQRLREFELHITPDPRLILSAYKRGGRTGRYQHATVAIANTGNVPVRVRVRGKDPKNIVKVDLKEGDVEIEPFETVELDALLRGPFLGVGQKGIHTVQFETDGMQLNQSFDYSMEQKPALGKSLKPMLALSAVAILAVVLWPRYTELEDYVGQDIETVTESMASVEIKSEVEQQNRSEPAGIVVGTRPRAGESVGVGGFFRFFPESVIVVTSLGPETSEIPEVVGSSRAAAESKLGSLAEIGVVVVYQDVEDELTGKGLVVRTQPPSGQLKSGDSLTVFVSSGPALFEVPDFKDMNIGEVRQGAEALGLEVNPAEERMVTDPALDGIVVDQIPQAGESTQSGNSVTVWLGVFEEEEVDPVAGDGEAG